MTNEEARHTLKSLKDYYNDKNEDSYVGFDNEDNEALDMAIKALEQEQSEDCISREQAIRVAEQGQIQGFEWQFKKLCALPSVTPKQKVGKWKIFTDINADQRYSCNICNNYIIKFREDNRKINYCPYCGCWMKGEG